jgi:hypothetical protein
MGLRVTLIPVCLGLVVAITANAVFAGPPRALPEGQLPDDWRLKPLKDLDDYFPFDPPETREQWAVRSERIRRQVLVALGLWPMPTETPLNPVIHGKIERDGYTVEKAYFESYPGFYVTGNLYRPRRKSAAKSPGVLCPHGHWNEGRFYDCGLEAVRRQVAIGAERFEEGGRSPLQSRCVQLARMGCVVFHYDMIGYADSVQISFSLAHRFARQRPEMNTVENWGLFSPQAEANLQSVMGLQTYNSIRALDFLESLPDVDPQRLAVTGASGGGTQTFILSAVDPRPAVAVPAVMVSTAMQGGCTCENACLLRIGTGNVEIAGLCAPTPLGLTAADDWTREMETKGFPELKRLYALLGKPDDVMLKPLLHFKHNYNYVSRAAMYSWFNRHLKLGLREPVVEEAVERLTPEQMTVWSAEGEHQRPEGGPDFERRLLRWITEDTRKQLERISPRDGKSWQQYRDVVGPAVDIIVGRGVPSAEDIEFTKKREEAAEGHTQQVGLVSHRLAENKLEQLPVVVLKPRASRGRAVVWIDGGGKAALFADTGSPRPEVQELLAAGRVVIGADLLFQGEFLADGQPVAKTRRVENTRESAAYTFAYNHTLCARRVHDVLTLIAFAGNLPGVEAVDLCGVSGAGHWVALARAQAGEAATRAAIDTGRFRFGRVPHIHDVNFLPGGAKYGDLPAALALSAPHELWVAGETAGSLEIVRSAYRAATAQQRLTVCQDGQPAAASAVQWLIRPAE